jgi:hypothetical protein
MSAPNEIILCSLDYRHQELQGMCVNNTSCHTRLFIMNNTIYTDVMYNGNPQVRTVLLNLDFEIDKQYIDNLKVLLFGVLQRNEQNKYLYKWVPKPGYPIIYLKENIVDFKTPILLYNKIYLEQKNAQTLLLQKEEEIAALRRQLIEKDNVIASLNLNNSVFHLPMVDDESFDQESDIVELTWL